MGFKKGGSEDLARLATLLLNRWDREGRRRRKAFRKRKMLEDEWDGNKESKGSEHSYLPTSNAGEASGDTSVVMVNMPSNFRSGDGAVMLAEARTRTLIGEKSISFSQCTDIGVEVIPFQAAAKLMFTLSSLNGRLRHHNPHRR